MIIIFQGNLYRFLLSPQNLS